MTGDVAVIIPTLRRPESLARAVRSVLAQTGVGDLLREIVIVDNDPKASALDTVLGLRPSAPWPLVYVHAQEPGVANARNAGLAATSAPLIAFLDDDETADPDWLKTLHAAHQTLGVDVTFTPIRGVADGADPDCRAWLDQFFARTGPAQTQRIDHAFGCGASMFSRATALPGPAPFDPAMNATGGEDDRLFQQLAAAGARFGWAADAWVNEHPPANRVRPAYALQRALAYGQSPCQLAWRAGPAHWPRIPVWMAIGLVQATLFGGAFAALRLMRQSAAWPMADRAARGLGKLFWMFRLEFYGVSSAG